MTIVNDPERGSRVLKIRFWDLNERVKRVSKTSTRVLIEEITIFREIQLGCTYSVSEEEWRFSRTEKILLEITSMSRDKLLVGRDYWGEAFLGIASLFFFLLSSFLLVNDLWPNIEGYSIIIIITATLCSLFFFFLFEMKISEIFYFCSSDWVRRYFGDNSIDIFLFQFVKENCICSMIRKSSILE